MPSVRDKTSWARFGGRDRRGSGVFPTLAFTPSKSSSPTARRYFLGVWVGVAVTGNGRF